MRRSWRRRVATIIFSNNNNNNDNNNNNNFCRSRVAGVFLSDDHVDSRRRRRRWMTANCIMLSYMAPSVNDKPPTVPSRLTLVEHKSAMATTAYHRFSRPPSITFNVDGQLQQREGFSALPAPPVRRAMVKEDSASSIASSVDVLPATHEKRPANKPATLKRSVSPNY